LLRHKYKRILGYGLRQWPAILLILGLSFATSAVTILQPWPLKLLVDHALGVSPLPTQLNSVFDTLTLSPTPVALVFAAALAGVGLFLLNSALDVGLTLVWTAAGKRMVYDLSADLFSKLQRLSLLFHSRRTVGDSLSRLTGDTWCVHGLTTSLLVSPLQHLFTLVTVSVVAWKLDPSLTTLSLCVAPLLGGSTLLFGRRLKRRTRQNREAQSRLFTFVHQTLSVMPAVQAFSTEERNRTMYRRLAEETARCSQRGALLGNTQGIVHGVTTSAANALILYFGGVQVLSGSISVGALLVFLAYIRAMQSSMQGLLGIYVNVKSAEANIDRVIEDLDAEDEVVEAPDAKPLPMPPRGRGLGVLLDHITFGYEAGRPVLEEVTLEARTGEMVAVVGPTGAGKTTLLSLIPRFFDPWEGSVRVNGVDIRGVKLSSLRSQVSLVLQEPLLLPLTVAENISYGRPDATRSEIVAAAEAANAHEFIRRLPRGYETVIGERGATLSGGERQRLSIARALLKDAPLLILDEPTSALDAQTEKQIMEAMWRLLKGRTAFIIAHRLSTIRRADSIVELVGGRIAGAGTHQELMLGNGLYAGLQSLQNRPHTREVSR
jgi:ATP-binding cassette subfamily B protein/subfamily B ATP-binding cassette protein MsbA